MLAFSNVELRRGGRVLFRGASFTVHPRWKVGITGANGAGKSSLLALVQGELHPEIGEFRCSPRLRIAHVAQESGPSAACALEYVIDGDAELRAVEAELTTASGTRAARLHAQLEAIEGYGARHRAARLLDGLGFTNDDGSRPVGEFSGGWRMRLNLAQALMTRSDLLLLDEPTNHLDLDATLWLEDWLARYEGTLLLISHDRDFLDTVVDHIVHIELGRARLLTGNYSAFEARRAEELAQQQAAYQRQQREIEHVRAFVARFGAKAAKARQAQSRLKALARMELIAPAHADSPFGFEFRNPKRMGRPLLEIEDASAGYGSRVVLEALSFTLGPGDRIALLGRNGAGKSTLVKLLAGTLAPFAGAIRRAPDLAVGYFAQHQLEQLQPDWSALRHLMEFDPRATEEALRTFLGGFGFSGDAALVPAGTFSGGEKARLALALVVYRAPQVLLLDEPTNHLDLDMRHALTMALQDFEGAVVLVSHDRHLLRTVADTLWLVADRRVAPYAGDLDDYRAWLLAPESSARAGATAHPNGAAARKARRRLGAEARARLRPLTREVEELERRLNELATEQRHIDGRLAEPGLYAPDRVEDLKALHLAAARVRGQTAEVETRWFAVSERLEAGRAETADG
jgi:ATP-binding cassette subfamily F protein 3